MWITDNPLWDAQDYFLRPQIKEEYFCDCCGERYDSEEMVTASIPTELGPEVVRVHGLHVQDWLKNFEGSEIYEQVKQSIKY